MSDSTPPSPSSAIRSRYERAQRATADVGDPARQDTRNGDPSSTGPDVHIGNDDPLIVQIQFADSDSEYTVVPNVAHCGCPDNQYRDVPCKHLLYLAISDEVDPEIRDQVRTGIHETAQNLDDEYQDLQDRLDRLDDRRDAWLAADDILGSHDDTSRTERVAENIPADGTTDSTDPITSLADSASISDS